MSALEAEDELGIPFAAGRTLLCWARVSSVRGDPQAAATHSSAARTRFERLGARPFSERAAEVFATNDLGASELSPSMERLVDVLRPSELRVAVTLADGLTTRAAGELLFLSAKTVDKHLQSTYRKLGINNRTQLARRVAAETVFERI